MTQPTDLEQLMLEYINDARLDPMGNAARYITGYSPLTSDDSQIQYVMNFFGVSGSALQDAYQALAPAAPLAWNNNLGDASHAHTQAMISAREQSHQVAGEVGIGARFTQAG